MLLRTHTVPVECNEGFFSEFFSTGLKILLSGRIFGLIIRFCRISGQFTIRPEIRLGRIFMAGLSGGRISGQTTIRCNPSPNFPNVETDVIFNFTKICLLQKFLRSSK